MKIDEMLYYLRFGFECFVLQKRKPIVAGIALTDLCNLQCKHCVVANVGRGHYSFEKIYKWMQEFYKRGARILYFQGGEPLGWQDDDKRINDLTRKAREIGYFKVAVTTNGTKPIESDTDVIWVSIDGLSEQHDQIRGEGVFNQVINNIDKSSHKNININMTVNTLNYKNVEDVIRFTGNHSKIHGVSINFHTPYPGVEQLFLSMDKRSEVIKNIIRLKKEGLPVLNSISGLKALMTGTYKRPSWMIQMVEKDQIFECCWEKQSGKVCEKCGFGVIAELSQLSELRPGAVIQAFNIFKGNGGF